jgi:signal transduction protein with GAF and PtsI domain
VADSETNDPEGELRHYHEAVEETLADLKAGQQQLAGSVPDDLVEIFTIYEMLLRSADFSRAVEGKIESGASAASALRAVVSDYAARFEAMDDAYFRARSEDIRALGSRVYSR